MKIKDFCLYAPKSNIKVKDSIPDGEFMFFTSSVDKSKRYSHYQIDGEGIIMGTGGNATLHYYNGKFAYSTDCIVLLPDNRVKCKYLYYFFLANMNILEAGFRGSGLKHTSKRYINDIKFGTIPSIEEQIKVVFNLDKITEIIDRKKSKINMLNDIIKSQFIEMFGNDCKFKKEKLEKNVVEMFIGPFGSSLKNECFVDKSKSYCMVYEQKHAINKSLDLPTRFVDENKYNELKRFTVLGGDIIISCRGTIGEIYLIPDDAPIGIMHPSIMKIRLKKEKYNNTFFVKMLEQYMKENSYISKGSGVKMGITASDLGKQLFIIPPIKEQKKFEDFANQIDKSKFAIQQSIDELQLLFDSLMQKYFG